MEIEGVSVLTDPIRETVYGGLSSGAEEISFDLVLISHSHRDHMDVEVLRQIRPKFLVVPRRRLRRLLEREGIPALGVSPWESLELNGLRLTAVPAVHLDLSPASLVSTALGYVLEGMSLSVYFAGDTGFSKGLFRRIGRFFKINVAFLPVAPNYLFLKWHHLGAVDAVRASKFLNARVFVPIHWGVLKRVVGNSERAVEELLRLSPEGLRLLKVGERISWTELLGDGA